MSNYIDANELTKHFTDNQGSVAFFENLNKCKTDENFLYILSQYIDFNNCFAAAQANLASRIANCDFFRDQSDDIILTQDKSAEVASLVFYAAIDEFEGVPHRTMSQHTLKSIANYFKFDNDIEKINRLTQPSDFLEGVKKKAHKAYGFNESCDNYKNILFNIGTHIATEGTATSEFINLLKFIDDNYAGLGKELYSSNLDFNDLDIEEPENIAAKELKELMEYTHKEHQALEDGLSHINLESLDFKKPENSAASKLKNLIDNQLKELNSLDSEQHKALEEQLESQDSIFLRELECRTNLSLTKTGCMNGLDWIRIHTHVDQDHFEKAVTAANIAIKYRPEGVTKEDAIQKIREGIACLEEIQEAFLEGITNEISISK